MRKPRILESYRHAAMIAVAKHAQSPEPIQFVSGHPNHRLLKNRAHCATPELQQLSTRCRELLAYCQNLLRHVVRDAMAAAATYQLIVELLSNLQPQDQFSHGRHHLSSSHCPRLSEPPPSPYACFRRTHRPSDSSASRRNDIASDERPSRASERRR